jgi:uncharacterized protein YggE
VRLVIAAAAAALLASAAAVAQPSPTLAPGEALISVEAEGKVASRPDTMTIAAGTVTTGSTAEEAVNANAALAQRLIAAVRGSGIEGRDVRTSNFAVRPNFERRESRDEAGPPPRITGYVVENHIEIRLRDLRNAQALIGRLFEAGANSVRGPTFSLSDDRQARREAERRAIEEARAEAENYAATIGRRLSRVLRIGDRRSWTEPMTETIYVTGSRVMPTPIEPGEIETRAIVYIDFALAPQ